MTTCYLSPVGNNTQTSTSGAPLSGGLIYTYQAGTSTPQASYMDNSGAVGQSNPIILNTYGLPANPIWLVGGQSYKFVIKDALGNTIRTLDNVMGINDFSRGPAFMAYKTTNQSLVSGALTMITFDAKDFDVNNTFSTTRWTPGVSAVCDVTATLSAQATTGPATIVVVEIWKNGASFARGFQTNSGSSAVQGSAVSCKVSMSPTDYLEIFGSITGTNPMVGGGVSPRITHFSGSVVRLL